MHPSQIRWFAGACLVAAMCALPIAKAQTVFDIPTAGGGVLAADRETLIVSAPKSGLLIYFDTVKEKETKRVELEFQPDRLAIQGDKLFAAVKGAAKLFVLDAMTAKEIKEIPLTGEPIEAMACHPTRGLLYVTNQADQVFSIDPASGKVTKTKARGQKLAVDPVDGKTVYTGIQKPIRDVLVIHEGATSVKVSLDKVNLNAMMMKFGVKGADLEPLAVNDNVAINGRDLAVSADGKRVAMAGGGGWKPAGTARYNYCIATFDTKDLTTLAGQIDMGPYPEAVAWHPLLNLGVAKRSAGDGELVFFNAKSLAEKKRVKVNAGGPAAMLFAAHGTKVAHVVNEKVTIVTLDLTEQDREKLKSASKSAASSEN